jgi:hypothetical protein
VCGLLGLYSTEVFAVNASRLQRMPPPRELLDALRQDPASVVITDADLADIYSLVAPRIHFSAMARSQTLRSQEGMPGEPTTAERFENYQCVKQQLSRAGVDAIDPSAFGPLDRGFRYLNQDFLLVHLNRKASFRQYFDPAAAPGPCAERSLTVFPAFVVGSAIGGLRASEAVTTPPQQWAYASVRELPAVPPAARGEAVLVRTFITVTDGCLDVGVLTPDQRTFVAQTTLTSAAGEQRAELMVDPAAKPNWLVISNCSAAGPSRGAVRAVDVFPVARTTTRSVAARLPYASRP